VLQRVVVCCSVLQCVMTRTNRAGIESSGLCSVLQCVAVCCCVMQCVAVFYSALLCVAVCCCVLQRVRTTTSRAGITVGVCVCVCDSQPTPHIGFECKGLFCEYVGLFDQCTVHEDYN